MPPRRSPRLSKISPKTERPHHPPKKDKKVPPAAAGLISRQTMDSVHDYFQRTEALIFGHQVRISNVESRVGNLESAQKNMKKIFDATLENERKEQKDAMQLMDLKILGLNHKQEAHKEKTQECMKNLLIGQRRIFKAVEEVAYAGEGAGEHARAATTGRMEQDIAGTSIPPIKTDPPSCQVRTLL